MADAALSSRSVNGGNRSPTMPHQWQRQTNSLLDTARRFQDQSAKQRMHTANVSKNAADRVVNDSSVSNTALRRKLEESEALKARSEAQLQNVVQEIVELEDEAMRAENVLEIMKDPLTVAEECLAVRARRPLPEQTRDSVERTLNEQAAAARHALRMLQGVLDACQHEQSRLRQVQEQLDEDIDHKRQALDVDGEALGMDAGWMPGPGSDKWARSASLPHMWRKRTENVCEEAERVLATCKRLRAKSRQLQQEAFNVERSTRESVLRALAKKIADTDRLRMDIDGELRSVSNEISSLEETKLQVEEAIDAKHGPLALARSRLHIRQNRPNAEQVRDEAERMLEREIADLDGSIHKLSQEQARLVNDIGKLEESKIKLEQDISDKVTALGLEQDCDIRERELGDRISSSFE